MKKKRKNICYFVHPLPTGIKEKLMYIEIAETAREFRRKFEKCRKWMHDRPVYPEGKGLAEQIDED